MWDWNGTLLDDVQTCVDSINQMLRRRNLEELSTDRYRSVFGFPVKDYYEKVGFDFSAEPFDVMAVEFIDLYRQKLPFSRLFPEVRDTLEHLHKKEYRQFVLSAMEQQMLESSLVQKGIRHYFEMVAGTGDHFAHGKDDAAQWLAGHLNGHPYSVLLIGDTVHDFEVAKGQGWQCVLVTNGHQIADRLSSLGCTVVDKMEELGNLLNHHSG